MSKFLKLIKNSKGATARSSKGMTVAMGEGYARGG